MMRGAIVLALLVGCSSSGSSSDASAPTGVLTPCDTPDTRGLCEVAGKPGVCMFRRVGEPEDYDGYCRPRCGGLKDDAGFPVVLWDGGTDAGRTVEFGGCTGESERCAKLADGREVCASE